MGQDKKLTAAILSGVQDRNISFGDLCNLLVARGFSVRVRGDHHIFPRPDVAEIINLQPDGNKAKPYQVRQVRGLILKYKLGGEE